MRGEEKQTIPTKQPIHSERMGDRQTLRIPREYELASDEVFLHKKGERHIIEPIRKPSLLALLATREPISDPFPDVDEGEQ